MDEIQYNSEESGQMDDYNQQMADKAALDSIELQEKTVEPDDKVSGKYANRNYQLGNIREQDLRLNDMRASLAQDWINVPLARGGWLINAYGDHIMRKLDLYFIMSNSVGGMARKNEKTLRRENSIQGGQKPKRTLLGTPKEGYYG